MTLHNKERWNEIQKIFEIVIHKESQEREILLKNLCQDDYELFEEVSSLLEADEDSKSILEGAAIDAVYTNFFDDVADKFSFKGKQVGQYRLLERIASGGMGAVYLAERIDGQFEHKVAVKLIKPGMDSEQIIKRFQNERQILANLDHPNIARLLDGGLMEGNLPYFTMEYVEGEPIDIYCNNNNLSIKKRLQLFQTVCAAVQYAHRNLVIHRDLKPSNILVTKDGTVKLLDFGIAKVFGEDEQIPQMTALTQPGLKIMTPEYASPEQVLNKLITTSSDVYSLGIILYQLLVKIHPFELKDKSATEVENIICTQIPDKPSTAIRKYSTSEKSEYNGEYKQNYTKSKKELRGDLDTISLMTLRKEPERRYGSPEQLSDDISLYLSGRPILAMRDSVVYRSRKFIKRHKASLVAAFISFIIINFLVVYYTLQLASERDRAKVEAEKASQVSDFLSKLFEVSDPSQSKGETITARELLDSGTERIESELAGQPAVQAEMYQVVGKVYMSLGLYPKAENILNKALLLNKNVYGEIHQDVAKSLNLLGSLYFSMGEYENTIDYFDEALSILYQLPKEYEAQIASTIFNQASIMHELGKYEIADSLYRGSIILRQKLHGEKSVEVAESKNGLAKLFNDIGDYENSEILYNEALSIKREKLGNLHPSVTQTINDLAFLYQVTGKWNKSESLLRKALELDIKMLGEEHPNISTNWYSLGTLLHNTGKYDEAEMLLRKALDADKKHFGFKHPYIALDQNNLAGVLGAKGNDIEAESLYRSALKIQENVLGIEHPEVATTTSNLALLLLRKGEVDSAEILIKRALGLRKKLLGEEHAHVSISMNHLGNVYMKKGEYEKAGPLYLQGLEMRERLMGDEHPKLIIPILSVANFRIAIGDSVEAEELFRKALEISEKSFPPGHPTKAITMFELGEFLNDKNQFSEAMEILKKAKQIRNEVFDSNHKSIAKVNMELGRSLTGLGKYSQAEKEFLESFSIYRNINNKDKSKVVDYIIDLYIRWGKPKQADEFAIFINDDT